MEHLKGTSIGLASALFTNIRQGWKSLPGTNTPTYYRNLQITATKCLITFRQGVNVIKKISKEVIISFVCSLTLNYKSTLKRIAKYKHTSLLVLSVGEE